MQPTIDRRHCFLAALLPLRAFAFTVLPLSPLPHQRNPLRYCYCCILPLVFHDASLFHNVSIVLSNPQNLANFETSPLLLLSRISRLKLHASLLMSWADQDRMLGASNLQRVAGETDSKRWACWGRRDPRETLRGF